MSKHLIVISIDAMVYEDLEYVRELPSFRRLLDGAAVIEKVKTIYPSVTHPVHATIITGAPAGVTGIINNYIFEPEGPDVNGKEWYNRLCDIKCDTLIHAAKRAGLTTAVSSWPLTTEGGDMIDYALPGALNYCFEGHEDDPLSVFRALGAKDNTIDIIAEGVRRHGYRDVHPTVDDLQIYCASEIIKKYKPNLLLIHPGDVDSKRHGSGIFGAPVKEALDRCDGWLGKIFAAIDEAGIADETDLVVLSDHGQINITRVISPNVWLVDRGYIKLDENGRIKSWDAYVKSTGASAQVFLSRPDDEVLKGEIYALLSEMAQEGIYGFERVYTVEQTREKYGLYGDFSFVLETDGYTGFGERLTRPAVTGYDPTDYRAGRGTHGHEPHKGPQPCFVAKGPSFKGGVTLKTGDILNHAPTLARALGVELRDAVGKAVEEILK